MTSTIIDAIDVFTLPESDPEFRKFFKSSSPWREKSLSFQHFESDRATWRGYDRVYTHYLGNLYDSRFNLMEVGIETASGLYAWAKYFTKANVYGIERRGMWHEHYLSMEMLQPDEAKRVHMNYPKDSTLQQTWEIYDDNFFDVIVDDGDHRIEKQLQTLLLAYSKLKSGGWYFVEDVKLHFRGQLRVFKEQFEPLLSNQKNVQIYYHENPNSAFRATLPNHLLVDLFAERGMNLTEKQITVNYLRNPHEFLIAFQKP